jgi:acetolactate synthase-1/3 small subunit
MFFPWYYRGIGIRSYSRTKKIKAMATGNGNNENGKQTYTISAFSENHIGLLNRITIIFTRRHVNIESLTVSVSAIKGIHKFTIVVNETREKVEQVVSQIEKLVEVLKAFYHTDDEVIYQEIALFKVPTQALIEG